MYQSAVYHCTPVVVKHARGQAVVDGPVRHRALSVVVRFGLLIEDPARVWCRNRYRAAGTGIDCPKRSDRRLVGGVVVNVLDEPRETVGRHIRYPLQ